MAGDFDLKAEEDLKDPVDVNWLWQSTCAIRERIIRQLKEKRGCEPVLQAELRRIALEGVENGWAEAPFTKGQVTEVLGPLWLPTRRFSVVQGQRFTYRRFVRDFVNSTAGFVICSTLCQLLRSWQSACVEEPQG